LNQLAEAEEFFGNSTKAEQFRTLAGNLVDAINLHLWSKTENDHYITNLNADGSIRDFVDYDANTLAVAFGVATPNRASALLKRVDGGKCTHAGRATYVSEIYYNASNCFIGNTGDSAVTMGRIAWGDGVARYRVGDTKTFYNAIFNPLLNDLLRNTWLNERYTCQGTPAHSAYFHEYPEMLFMLMHEVIFGVNIGLNSVRISPFPENPGPTNYTYGVGSFYIAYSQDLVILIVPGSSSKNITIEQLHPSTNYDIKQTPFLMSKQMNAAHFPVLPRDQTVRSDTHGVLDFIATTGLETAVVVSKN